jgi:hypothetical protein
VNPSEMTNEQLNEAVAVEVMGWEWCPKLLRWVHGPTLADTTSKREWFPSTDISAAFSVVEKMQNDTGLYPDFIEAIRTAREETPFKSVEGWLFSLPAEIFARVVSEAAILASRKGDA